ncbi:MAG TPA: oligosaccharide flippase family protein [Casimicrobiaceae bacterium]
MLRGVAVLWLGQVVSKLIAFVAFAYLARKLSTPEYGAVEYAFGLATFAALAIDGGLGSVGVRRLAQGEQPPEKLAAIVPAAQFCLAVIIAPGMILFAWLFANDSRAVTLVALVAVSVLLLPWKQEWLFQAFGKQVSIAFAQTIRVAVFAVGVVAFVAGSADVNLIGVMEIVSVAAATLYLLSMQRREIAPLKLRFAWRDMLSLVREGSSIGAAAIVWALIQYAPLMMLARMAGMTDTAYFGAAHRLAVSLVTFSWIYHFNFYPLIARRMLADPSAMAALTRASFRVAAWGGIGLALALTLAAEPLLALLFGDKFKAAAPAFSVLVWTFPVTLLSGHARWMLVAARRPQDMLAAQLGGCVVAIAAGPLLIGRFGTVGAGATILLACLVIWALAQALVTLRVRAAPAAPCIVPAVLAAAILLASQWLAANPWMASGLGLVAFGALAPLVDRAFVRDLGRVIRVKSLFSTSSGRAE